MWTFQSRAASWAMLAFGEFIAKNKTERNLRFIEEAVELVQACGATEEHVLRIVRHVFSRPPGDREQEVGGTLVTLSALCEAQGIDIEFVSEVELARCYEKIEKIRGKQLWKQEQGIGVDLEGRVREP